MVTFSARHCDSVTVPPSCSHLVGSLEPNQGLEEACNQAWLEGLSVLEGGGSGLEYVWCDSTTSPQRQEGQGSSLGDGGVEEVL